MKTTLIILTVLLPITFAFHDAMNDRGKERTKGCIKIIMVILACGCLYIAQRWRFDIIQYAWGLLFLSGGTFNVTYNLAKGNKWYYVGTGTEYDRWIARISKWWRLALYICFIAGGLFALIKL